MMRILYDLIFLLFGLLYLPHFIFSGRYKYGTKERMGFLSGHTKAAIAGNKIIWIHAVSVGEMKVAGILAPLLRKSFPDHKLLFSSVTHTGNKVARTIAKPEEAVFYLPFDISFIVNKVVGIIKPELFLCLETELWPNLISSLYRAGTKIVLLNGRISDKSYFGYKRVKVIVRKILSKFSLILMQSQRDYDRALDLGALKHKVFISGNLKFDVSLPEGDSDREELRKRLGLSSGDILLVAGSTHKGEESQVIETFLRLQRDYGNLRLLIAPRHPERTQEIEQLLFKKNIKPLRYSSLLSEDKYEHGDKK